MPGGIPEGRDSVMVGTSLQLISCCYVSYTWWFVFVLSSAAAHGGAISANSQRGALHQPRTSYSFPFSYLFPSIPSLCVGMSYCVSSYLAYVEISFLLYFVQCPDPQARINLSTG